MKFTLSWLKTHLETDADLKTIIDTLTMTGLEVDAVVDRSAELAPFTVALVETAVQHPNADKLRVCTVNTGRETLQVVCGAPNARAGIKVVFAAGGTTIPRNGMLLKPSKIRGEDSNGMLCSAFEMGLSDDHDGIIELPADAPIGVPFARVLGLDDPMLDVKITANRADCLGVRGIARDLAAAGLGRLKPLAIAPVAATAPNPLTLTRDPAAETACPLFILRVIRGVKNGPSPQWLQDRLLSIGLRPISALVDLTNFSTFDLNRPLHVFDAAKIKGPLTVRAAVDGESLAALNGKTYTLESGMTVIADETGPISLGGVIGGADSGVGEATVDVVLEVALFDPRRTAATGRKLNLQSDARYRFERGLDPAFALDAVEHATRLIIETCGGTACAPIQVGSVPQTARTLSLRPSRVLGLGGVEIPVGDMVRILTVLGASVETGADGVLAVTVPSWRADIEGEADLVEEILRLYGYDHIPVRPLRLETALPRPAIDGGQRRAGFVRRTLAERGLNEAVTYSFTASSLLHRDGHALFASAHPGLSVVNPISADLDVMRPSILPNLIDAAKRNQDRGLGDVALFEVGPQYADDTPGGQSLVASGIRTGRLNRKQWNEAARPVDPFTVKADVIAALAAAGVPVDNLQVTADPPSWYHPGRAGTVRLGPKTVLAHFGELHPRIVTSLDLKGPVMAFEIHLDRIPAAKAGRQRAALKLSAFQAVERDFAFLVDQAVTAEQVLRAAKGADKKLIADVRLFDLYDGQGVPDGKKSLALTIVLQPVEATLTEAEIDTVSNAVIAQVAKATGGTLRG